jgi:hypothetical protein
MKLKSTWLLLAAVVGFAGAAFAQKKPTSYNSESVESVTATVIAVDVAKRLIELRGPQGRTETFEVSDEVRNLPQVKVGDNLVVRYYASINAEIRPKGAPAPVLSDVGQSVGAARAPEGAKPAVAVGNVVSQTVVIQSVDNKTHTVMFSGPDGLVRNVQVQNPDAQKFIATLKKGDQVDVTFGEALAVSVEAAK